MNVLPLQILAAFLVLGFTGTMGSAYDDPNPHSIPHSAQRHSGDNWSAWRGPLMTGESPDGAPPIAWSENKHVRWKTPLNGLGHSSPIVVGNYVFLTYARRIGESFEPRPDTAPGAHDNRRVDSKHAFVAAAFDRYTGKLKWERELRAKIPHEGAHVTASLASASPVANDRFVWFFFGSHGLFCLDHDGQTKWERDFGIMNSKHGHGEGASPVLDGHTIAINWDHEGQSFVAALDARDGKTVWRQQRDEVTSWSSPIVVEHAGKKQLIVAGTNRTRAYDLDNGDVIWQCGGLSNNVVATPVSAKGFVYVGNSYDQKQMMAIRLDGASGDITSSEQVVWSRRARTPYVPSPLLVNGHIYFLRHYQGILTRLNAKTGEEPSGPFRLGQMNDIYASPVSAAGRIYVTDRTGTTAVMSTATEPEILGVNRLNDRFSASAAIAGDAIFLRGEKFLYCLATEKGIENE